MFKAGDKVIYTDNESNTPWVVKDGEVAIVCAVDADGIALVGPASLGVMSFYRAVDHLDIRGFINGVYAGCTGTIEKV